ncbi:MAG: 50S ribosomal protein L24 [Chlamydiia bacterium]|nr:50S ribosomal protein L24 [Chlamydiia bacterium]
MSKWIRKGDRVKVVAGNDKGKTGEVLGRSADRVLVQGVNVRKKHLKRTQESQGARIIEMEVPIHISNVALCDKEGVVLKVSVAAQEKGKRALVFKSGKEDVVYRSVKKPAY